MTHALFYNYKFAYSLVFVAPLSFIFEDIGAKEVIIIIIIGMHFFTCSMALLCTINGVVIKSDKRLKECMCDKAIDYILNRSRKERNDYRRLMKRLKNRYGVNKNQSVVQQNHNHIKQEVTESLEDFANRVQHAVAVGYKEADVRTIEKWAAELFLKGKGCSISSQREAAKVNQKNPEKRKLASATRKLSWVEHCRDKPDRWRLMTRF